MLLFIVLCEIKLSPYFTASPSLNYSHPPRRRWTASASYPTNNKNSYPGLHDIGVLEVVDQCCWALYPGISQFADFLAVEPAPPFAVELKVELGYELGVDEVDKRITHVARVVGVYRQVEEVVFVPVVLVHLIDQHLLRVLIRYVPNHYSRTSIILNLHESITENSYLINVDFELLVLASYRCGFSLPLLLRQTHEELLVVAVV